MKKYIVIIIVSVLTASAVQAQDRLARFAKPGAQFAPAMPARRAIATTTNVEKHDESLGAQVKKGLGMKVQGGGGATTTRPTAARRATVQPTDKLASEVAKPKALPVLTVKQAVVVPTQEEAPAKQ